MSSKLEAWLEQAKLSQIYNPQSRMKEAIAVIEKLKSALEKCDCEDCFYNAGRALAINPEEL